MPQAGAQPATSGSSPPPPRRRWGGLRLALVLIVGVGIGTAISAGIPGFSGRTFDQVSTASDAVVPAATPRFRDAPEQTVTPPGDAGPRPGEPVDAVVGFLAAEAEGRFADAYSFLSAADQDEFGSAAGYVAAHADLLPPVRDFTVADVDQGDGSAAVVTELVLEPGLNEVAGLVPGRAQVTWTAVAADEGWAVELTSAEMIPHHPAEEQAVGDVTEWAAARQACQAPAPELEHRPLRGHPALAEDLCGAEVQAAVGRPEPLQETDAASYLAAYGGEVADWARVVHVGGPVDLRAVIAPVGDRWAVIGILSPETGA